MFRVMVSACALMPKWLSSARMLATGTPAPYSIRTAVMSFLGIWRYSTLRLSRNRFPHGHLYRCLPSYLPWYTPSWV